MPICLVMTEGSGAEHTVSAQHSRAQQSTRALGLQRVAGTWLAERTAVLHDLELRRTGSKGKRGVLEGVYGPDCAEKRSTRTRAHTHDARRRDTHTDRHTRTDMTWAPHRTSGYAAPCSSTHNRRNTWTRQRRQAESSGSRPGAQHTGTHDWATTSTGHQRRRHAPRCSWRRGRTGAAEWGPCQAGG